MKKVYFTSRHYERKLGCQVYYTGLIEMSETDNADRKLSEICHSMNADIVIDSFMLERCGERYFDDCLCVGDELEITQEVADELHNSIGKVVIAVQLPIEKLIKILMEREFDSMQANALRNRFAKENEALMHKINNLSWDLRFTEAYMHTCLSDTKRRVECMQKILDATKAIFDEYSDVL